jgi:hypothetical protein
MFGGARRLPGKNRPNALGNGGDELIVRRPHAGSDVRFSYRLHYTLQTACTTRLIAEGIVSRRYAGCVEVR